MTSDACQPTFGSHDPKHSASWVASDLVEKLTRVLGRLDAAVTVEDMDVQGFGLHRLTGDMRGFWSVTISRNWRLIFRFDEGDAFDVDFVDYH